MPFPLAPSPRWVCEGTQRWPTKLRPIACQQRPGAHRGVLPKPLKGWPVPEGLMLPVKMGDSDPTCRRTPGDVDAAGL